MTSRLTSRISIFNLIVWPLYLWAAPVRAAVVVNEVAFDQPTGSPDWVELFNAGPDPVVVDGWVLDDGDTGAGNHIVLKIPVPIPAGAYLLVFVDADGPDDLDFSDGAGHVYSGTATTVNLAATEDQAALYTGPVKSSATLVDFVAWVTDGHYNGSESDRAHGHAVEAGLWPADGVVVMVDEGSGYSLARRRDGQDTNTPQDFVTLKRPTPGASNAPAPSPYGSALTVDPQRRIFSPRDPDPDYQYTRCFFSAPPESVKSLRVYDAAGRLVRRLMEGDIVFGGVDTTGLGSGHVVWDGRDDAGVVVPMGLYAVLFESSDPASGATQRGRQSVAVGR